MALSIDVGTQFEVDTDGGLAKVAVLDGSTAIGLYSSVANGIEARHLTNTDGVITGGTVLSIDGNQADSITICKMTATSALIGYAYGATHITRVLTVSGTTLTKNAVKNMTDTGVDYLTCDLLDTDKIIYCWEDSAGDGISVVLTVSGTTVTENTHFDFESTTAINCSVTAISTTTAYVVWSFNPGRPQAQVLDISGTTVTGNIVKELDNINAEITGDSNLDIRMSSDGVFAYVFYRSVADSIWYVVISESSGTITVELSGTIWQTATGSNVLIGASVIPVRLADGADPGWDILAGVSIDDFQNYLAMQAVDLWNGGTPATDTTITFTNTVSIMARLFEGTNTAIVVFNDSTEAITFTVPPETFVGYDLVVGGGLP